MRYPWSGPGMAHLSRMACGNMADPARSGTIGRDLAVPASIQPRGIQRQRSAEPELRRRMLAGATVEGLDGRAALDIATLDRTDRIVAVAGVHPYIKLLDAGADVIIGGRSSDCAIFAAPAIRRGLPPALAYFAGKI